MVGSCCLCPGPICAQTLPPAWPPPQPGALRTGSPFIAEPRGAAPKPGSPTSGRGSGGSAGPAQALRGRQTGAVLPARSPPSPPPPPRPAGAEETVLRVRGGTVAWGLQVWGAGGSSQATRRPIAAHLAGRGWAAVERKETDQTDRTGPHHNFSQEHWAALSTCSLADGKDSLLERTPEARKPRGRSAGRVVSRQQVRLGPGTRQGDPGGCP